MGHCTKAILLATSLLLFGAPPAPAAQNVGKALDECEDGVRAADAGRWQEAEFRWLKAIAIDPAASCAYNNLAVMNERAGDFGAADQYYEKALERATEAARPDIADNVAKFHDARVADRVEGTEGNRPPGERDRERGARTMPVTISVPEAEGRELADFERILVGPFVVETTNAPVDVGAQAVAYFRRRIVQRSFFQAVDVSASVTSTMDDPLDDADMWARLAASVGADLVFTGRIGLAVNTASRLVSERIRAPNGQITEVSRFRNMIAYEVRLHYALLRGDDGGRILAGDLEGRREFAADDEIPANDMYIETLEELLPELLDAVTPERVEQTRVLIF